MTLIDEFQKVLARLNDGGWSSIFLSMGIDLAKGKLRETLLRPIDEMNRIRSLPGFEDLSLAAKRPIEPRNPAESVLFHALASPAVNTLPDGSVLIEFPTAADLDLAENVVFGIKPPSLEDIRAGIGNANLAIGVFAREYRQRAGTVHGAHADLIFARTGVTRVGTNQPHWDGSKRAFSPLEPNDDVFSFRVLPCRYGVYLAVQSKGDPDDFGPYKADRTFRAAEKFNASGETRRHKPQSDRHDADHDFWVPIHKLFSGLECLLGRDLNVEFLEAHFNEKLKRIHQVNMGVSTIPDSGGFDSGFGGSDLQEYPFIVRSGLAEFLEPNLYGAGTLTSIPRPRLVEPAIFRDQPIGTAVPEFENQRPRGLLPSFAISPKDGGRKAPEYVHVRTHLRKNGSERNLNDKRDVSTTVASGKVDNSNPYVARHYLDFTGDGWLLANVGGLPGDIARPIPAYSIIAAPDFYPHVSQSDVLDWTLSEVRTHVRAQMWSVPPLALCDQRSPPNLALNVGGEPFRAADATVSAMLGLKGSATRAQPSSSAPKVERTTYLPDGAAGVFAPGWDTSFDLGSEDGGETGKVLHLAAHGLGSPFPEDAKLCAALSAFWPAVAPDSSRSSALPVVAPMTDREIGLEDAPAWDGITGPRKVALDGKEYLEVDDFEHVDYVRQALNGRFSMSETMKVDQTTYQARMMANQRLYMAITPLFQNATIADLKGALRTLTFKLAESTDDELRQAQSVFPLESDPVYKFVLVSVREPRDLEQDDDNKNRWLSRRPIGLTIKAFVDGTGSAVVKLDDGPWRPPQIS